MVANYSGSKLFAYFLIIVILIFSVANYYSMLYRFEEIDKKLQSSKSSYRNLQDSEIPIKELRKAALLSADQVQRNLLESAVGEDNRKFYMKLRPEAYCPKKVRIGEKEDGGKIVCDPEKVKDDCTLMSLGLNNQVIYDQEIYNATGRKCAILAADMDPQNQNTFRAFAAMKGHVYEGKIPDNLTIGYMMQQEYKTELEILKIDIEGGEHTGLEPFLKEHFVCQILIEIHGWPPEQLEMLQKIARYGFRLFNIEPNKMCSRCCEYSFINELCMAQFGVSPLAVNIPRNLTRIENLK